MTSSQLPSAFARPHDVDGGFDPAAVAANTEPHEALTGRQLTPPEIAQAFRRPDTPTDPNLEEIGGLQRRVEAAAEEDTTSDYDPWSDPHAPVSTGEPALPSQMEPEPEPEKPLPKVGLREVLFGRSIGWHHIAGVALVTMLVGATGGFIGGWFGHEAKLTSNKVQLEAVQQPDSDMSAIGQVAEKVQPAVVSLSVTGPKGSGVGSGFVIDGAGYILTNNHVVSAAVDSHSAKITVQFAPNGDSIPQEATGRIVGRDPMTDLAVVKVNDVAGLTVAALGDSEKVKVGDQVLALGSPLGLKRTVTSGIVSALKRPVRLTGDGTDTDGAADAIQTDASINPGNSGGPLVDMSGAVVGVNTSIYSTTGGSQGLGFAIPINTARDIAEQLMRGATPKHADIGVTTRPVENGSVVGAQIASIMPKGPAAEAKLQEGDVITRVNNRPISGPDELMVAIWEVGVDNPAKVTVVRDGREITLEVVPKDR
ncbi:S1C family serine protease [Corynebacterium ulceribovis]|uniref:S1C family serine protease n=1 Tax=Corynebacterium ulceribovis TaxID=487732 RepID=UPI0003806C78|nr:trypsin-like peptidase domain-containing protein [Corynebacterium ulceribovis]